MIYYWDKKLKNIYVLKADVIRIKETFIWSL